MRQSTAGPSARAAYPPLASLEAVRIVARHNSLTAAAVELGITSGALSRRVAAVEAWLGTALFQRHGRGMRLTPDGHRFLSRVEEAFQIIEGAAEQWRGRRGSDVVKISVVPSLARLWLLERLERLERGGDLYGPLRVDIAIDDRLADVESGQVDLAIRYGRGKWRGLTAYPLMPERLVPVACRRIADELGEEPRGAAILSQTLLHDSNAVAWKAWLEHAGIKGFRPRAHDRRFEDYGLVLAAAEAGLGIALARRPFADQAVRAAGLVPLSERDIESPLTYYVVQRPSESKAAVLALSRRLLRAAAGAEPDD